MQRSISDTGPVGSPEPLESVLSDQSMVALEEGPEPEQTRSRFGFLRGGMTMVWILLAVLFSIVRACGDGSNGSL